MPSIDSERTQGTWNITATGTTAGASATRAGSTGKRQVASYISGSSDAAALVTIERDGPVILWRKRFTAAFTFAEILPDEIIEGNENDGLVARISASTANCELNFGGYQRE